MKTTNLKSIRKSRWSRKVKLLCQKVNFSTFHSKIAFFKVILEVTSVKTPEKAEKTEKIAAKRGSVPESSVFPEVYKKAVKDIVNEEVGLAMRAFSQVVMRTIGEKQDQMVFFNIYFF